MHRGFVKIYRKIMEWEWYTDVPVKVLFMHALIKANHSEKQWKGHTIKEGQFISSLGNMAKETGLSTAQVRTALKKLEKTKEICKKGTNKNTIVTVCNYESYMSEEQSNDNQMTNKEQSNDKQMTTTKNNKNNKNENNTNTAPLDKNGFLVDFSKWTTEDLQNNIKLVADKKPEYSKEMMIKFYKYWTAPNKKGVERFKKEKTWSTASRLATWYDNQKK